MKQTTFIIIIKLMRIFLDFLFASRIYAKIPGNGATYPNTFILEYFLKIHQQELMCLAELLVKSFTLN